MAIISIVFYTSGELVLSVLDVAMMPYLRQKLNENGGTLHVSRID